VLDKCSTKRSTSLKYWTNGQLKRSTKCYCWTKTQEIHIIQVLDKCSTNVIHITQMWGKCSTQKLGPHRSCVGQMLNETERNLRILVDSNMTFVEQCNSAVNSANTVLGMIKHTITCKNKNVITRSQIGILCTDVSVGQCSPMSSTSL